MHYRTASPDIVFEDFDGDMVVLNLATGQYFGLNPGATLVWTALTAAMPPEAIIAAMAQAGLPAAALTDFTDHLVAQGLIVADAGPGQTSDPALLAALAACPVAPMAEVYDDLADLIVADPIHDVDDRTGWPHLPPGQQDQ